LGMIMWSIEAMLGRKYHLFPDRGQ
jgi:hypothetical protein